MQVSQQITKPQLVCTNNPNFLLSLDVKGPVMRFYTILILFKSNFNQHRCWAASEVVFNLQTHEHLLLSSVLLLNIPHFGSVKIKMQFLFKGLTNIQKLSGDFSGLNTFYSAILIRLTGVNLSDDLLNSFSLNREKIEDINYSHDHIFNLRTKYTF